MPTALHPQGEGKNHPPSSLNLPRPRTPPLLGALTLEAAFMGVDPVAQKLVSVEGVMMGAALISSL